jgi:hypothetical protein
LHRETTACVYLFSIGFFFITKAYIPNGPAPTAAPPLETRMRHAICGAFNTIVMSYKHHIEPTVVVATSGAFCAGWKLGLEQGVERSTPSNLQLGTSNSMTANTRTQANRSRPELV